MYDELVKELRDYAEWADRLALLMGRAEGDTHAPIMRKAADAIEGLQKRVLLAPIDSYAGLKRKYIVLKADTGENVPDSFVLRPAKDKAAVEALRAYAKATDNDLLAADIYRWVGPLPEPPKEN